MRTASHAGYPPLTLFTKLDYPSHTFTTTEPTEELKALFDKVAKSEKVRSKNYEINKDLISRTLAYTVTTIEDGKPIIASLVWSRPMYNGIARLCTRYCIDPEFSLINFGKGTDGMRLDTMDHIIQQINICKSMGYTDFFIGREDWKSKGRRTRKIAKQMSLYTGIEWKVSDDDVLVSTTPEDEQSWQYIIYNNRKDFDYESEL